MWVQVQMEAPKLPSLSLSVRCGVLGTNLISLVTVSWEGFVDAQWTKLAVLHPELGTQQWAPASQVRWETSNSVSLTLTLEQSKARNFLVNTSFCCEFVTFPQGSRVACGDLNSSDPGVSGERGETGRTLTLAAHLTPFSVSRTLCPSSRPHSSRRPDQDLGNLGGSLVWFHLYTLSAVAAEALVRTGPVPFPHCLASCPLPLIPPLLSPRCFSDSQPSSTSTQAQMQMQVRLEGRFLERGTSCPPQPASQASLAALPYPPPDSAPLCEAMVHHDQHLPRDTPLSPDDPYQPTNPHCLSPQLPCLASAHGSFIYTENGLYALAGENLPHPIPDILASTDCLEYSTLCSGTQ